MVELELVEEYELLGEKRFRFRIKGTLIVINVSASSAEEGRKRAEQIVRDLKLDELAQRILKQTKPAS